MQTQKGWSGTSFQVAGFAEFFEKIIFFVIWYKLVKFHKQTAFTSQVFQWNVFLVLCLGFMLLLRHEIWISKIQNWFSREQKEFLKWNEKHFFLVS